MNVNYDKLGEVEGKIAITLEENDYTDKVKKQIKTLVRTQSIPGFRPGHAPVALIEKKFGTSVKYEVINKEVSDALFNYINENKLRVLGNPVPVRNDDFNIEAKDFTFEFEVGLAPEIKPVINADLHIPYYKIQVTDQMIEEQSTAMRRRMGEQKEGDTATEDAVVYGTIAELGEDGNALEGGIVNERGIVAPKYFKDEEQTKLFAGVHVGDKLVFNPSKTCENNPTEMASMLGIDKEAADKHTGDFSFEVTKIMVLEPAELGQEYYDKVFGADKVHDEKEYHDAMRDMIAGQLVADSNYRFSIDARETIEKAVGEITLPERILKEYLKMENANVNDDNVDAAYAEAVGGLKWQLIADKFAEEKELKVTEEDMKNVAGLMARNEFAKYGMTTIPDDVIEKYAKQLLDDEKVRRRIANETFEMQVFKAIHDTVALDEKEVSVEDFNKLFDVAEVTKE